MGTTMITLLSEPRGSTCVCVRAVKPCHMRRWPSMSLIHFSPSFRVPFRESLILTLVTPHKLFCDTALCFLLSKTSALPWQCRRQENSQLSVCASASKSLGGLIYSCVITILIGLFSSQAFVVLKSMWKVENSSFDKAHGKSMAPKWRCIYSLMSCLILYVQYFIWGYLFNSRYFWPSKMLEYKVFENTLFSSNFFFLQFFLYFWKFYCAYIMYIIL